MRDVTIIITAHKRPVALKQCLRSIRKYYPDVPVIVVTDAELTNPAIKAIHKARANLYILEYDAGLSRMRNKGVKEADTPYAMICEDDMEFIAETSLERLKSVLDADSKVALCAGSLKTPSGKRDYMNNLRINMDAKEYEILPIKNPEWLKTEEAVEYCYAEHVFNFFLLRKSSGLPWDNDLKIGIEHTDFFLRMKIDHPEWKAAITTSVVANHNEAQLSRKYKKDRGRKEYWEVFDKKMGFARGVNLNAKIIYDFKGKRTLPYPEYVFYLLSNKIKASREARTQSIQPARKDGG